MQKKFETWDEAFRGLTPAVRRQSVRVAAYTQAIFVKACQMGFGKDLPGGKDRMREEYSELAYKCGMYHQLGKAFLPDEYQIWRSDFSEEEKALYRGYPTQGRLLVTDLQEEGTKKRSIFGELKAENIPWLMIRESCQQHMENFDGSGYPEGKSGNEISPIAQIVGLATYFDHLSAEVKSEKPFTEAYDSVIQSQGKKFSPELCEVFKEAKPKLQGIFNKYIHYTMKIPRTIPLVKKDKSRPMWLTYRPMVGGEKHRIVMFQATANFSMKEEGTATLSEIAPTLERTNLLVDSVFYFLYEAADTLLRMANCKLEQKYLLFENCSSFYSRESHLKRFEELFEHQSIDRSNLLITIPEETVLSANKGVMEVVLRYLKNGINLVLDNYHPENISPAMLKEMGFSFVRFSPEFSHQPQYASDVRALRDREITPLASCSEKQYFQWLTESGVYAVCSPLNGEEIDEEELIRTCLMGEREQSV